MLHVNECHRFASESGRIRNCSDRTGRGRPELPMRAPQHSDENVVNGRFGAARVDGNRSPDTKASDGAEASASADYLEAASSFGYRPLPSQLEELSDAYWDTASFEILRSGAFLRLRGMRDGLRV